MKFFYLSMMLVLTQNTFAGCEFQTISSFYEFIKVNHPKLLSMSEKEDGIKSITLQAQERINPEVSVEYMKGDEFGLDTHSASLEVLQTFELGSKRKRRIEKGELNFEYEKLNLEIEKFSLLIDSLLLYQRFAQNKILVKSYEEAISTFKAIHQKLKTRGSLNPEERVSVATLDLAINSYLATLNDLKVEASKIEGELNFITKCENLNFPYSELKYESLSGKLQAENGKGLLHLEALKPKIAKKDYEIEESKTHTDLKFGPKISYEAKGRDEFYQGGVSLTFDIPFFKRNEGEMRRALSNYRETKLNANQNEEFLKIKKSSYLKSYERSLKLLKTMPSLKELDKKHEEVEKLFKRGIISISLVLESHKQFIDFLTSRLETENDLLESLRDIIQINGNTKLIEEIL